MIKNAFVLFIICAVIFVLYLPSYIQMQGLRARNEAYERQIETLNKDNEALIEERRRLIEDPSYFEKVAREKMGIIKEGEVVYKIVPAGTKVEEQAKPPEPEVKETPKPEASVKAAKPAVKKASKKKKKASTKKTVANSETTR